MQPPCTSHINIPRGDASFIALNTASFNRTGDFVVTGHYFCILCAYFKVDNSWKLTRGEWNEQNDRESAFINPLNGKYPVLLQYATEIPSVDPGHPYDRLSFRRPAARGSVGGL
jgi:hypothetical protein